eukprot:Gb_03982 [translate_table: standard]
MRSEIQFSSHYSGADSFMFYFTPRWGFFSPFPHGTTSLSVTQEYLALQGGTCLFTWDSTFPMLLGLERKPMMLLATGLSPSRVQDSTASPSSTTLILLSHNPVFHGLGCSHFARRYYGNHFCFLFLWLLRCFSSLGYPLPAHGFSSSSKEPDLVKGMKWMGDVKPKERASVPHFNEDLTQHLTTRADDSHAPPVSVFLKALLSFRRIHGMSSPGKVENYSESLQDKGRLSREARGIAIATFSP